MRNLKPKPLWGFGWAGWCLLAIAVALTALMIAGVDIRYWVHSRIIWNLGWPTLVWFTTSFITSHALYDFGFMPVISGWSWTIAPTPRFSLISMCLVLIALQVHPRRSGILRITAVVVLGVIVPGLTFTFVTWLRPLFGAATPATNSAYVCALTAFEFGSAAFTAIMLWWIIPSVRTAALCTILLVLGAWVSSETTRSSMTPPELPLLMAINATPWGTWLGWLWNPALFAVLLAWALRARRRIHPAHCCQSCGYDLRGTPEGKCPECGIASPPLAAPPLSTS